MSKPFITLDQITIRLREKKIFENTSFTIHQGEHLVVIGPNGSGKTSLVKAIAGLLPLSNGEIILNFLKNEKYPYPSLHKDKISYISFESHQNMLKQDELKKDLQEFSGKKNRGILVKEFLGKSYKSPRKKTFDISKLLKREFSSLSSGEQRKVFLIKALLKKPQLLILDEPFDGLDRDSKKNFLSILEALDKKLHLILVTHNIDEIPSIITHIMQVKNGKIEYFGAKETISDFSKHLFTSYPLKDRKIKSVSASDLPLSFNDRNKHTILWMKNINVVIKGKKVLKNISWEVKSGQNWAILGPNGAGKSTLLKLITGESLQSYSNDIEVFGKQFGVNTSVWEIKKRIGVVSTDLLFKHSRQITGLDAIYSGFFDSIGLYQKPNKYQIKKSLEWVKKLQINDLADKQLDEMSFGQRKIILISRAVVKSPKLLILDEPLHGLDRQYRERVLNMLEEITKLGTNIIYTTHNEEELIPSITRRIYLQNGEITALV